MATFDDIPTTRLRQDLRSAAAAARAMQQSNQVVLGDFENQIRDIRLGAMVAEAQARQEYEAAVQQQSMLQAMMSGNWPPAEPNLASYFPNPEAGQPGDVPVVVQPAPANVPPANQQGGQPAEEVRVVPELPAKPSIKERTLAAFGVSDLMKLKPGRKPS